MMPDIAFRRVITSTLLVLVGLLPSTAAAARGKESEPEKPGKPQIDLRIDPSFGFTPVTAVLTAELSGVDPDDPNFCHASITWVRIDPGRSEDTASNLRQDPVCRHAAEETHVTTHFTKRFALSRPGPYLFRLILEGKDRQRVVSGYAKVRVLRVQ